MTWVRLDDGFFRHPKAMRAGLQGRALFVAGLAHCAGSLTDGYVADLALPIVAAEAGVKPSVARQLVEVGLWERVDGGFQVHDFSKYHPTAEKVRAEREAAADRMRDIRNRKRSSGERHGERKGKFGGSSTTPTPPTGVGEMVSSRSGPSAPAATRGGADSADDPCPDCAGSTWMLTDAGSVKCPCTAAGRAANQGGAA